MEIFVSLVIFALLFCGVAGLDGNVYDEVRVGLVVDLSSIQGKILETSFSLALSDFYSINNGYRTRVSVSARDSQGDPILALAVGEFHLLQLLHFLILQCPFGGVHSSYKRINHSKKKKKFEIVI